MVKRKNAANYRLHIDNLRHVFVDINVHDD